MQLPHSIPYVFLKPWTAGGVGSLDHIRYILQANRTSFPFISSHLHPNHRHLYLYIYVHTSTYSNAFSHHPLFILIHLSKSQGDLSEIRKNPPKRRLSPPAKVARRTLLPSSPLGTSRNPPTEHLFLVAWKGPSVFCGRVRCHSAENIRRIGFYVQRNMFVKSGGFCEKPLETTRAAFPKKELQDGLA